MLVSQAIGVTGCFGGVIPLEGGQSASGTAAETGLAPTTESGEDANAKKVLPATGSRTEPDETTSSAPTTQFGSPGLGESLPSPLPPDASDKDLPAFLGDYQNRTYVHRTFVIASHSAVTARALDLARYIVEQMISPQQARQLRALGSALVVIGAQEVFTEQPGFTHFGLTTYGTSWNNTAGSGGSPSFPVTTIFERHLLQLDTDGYRSENILVHEFAHHVMEILVQSEHPEIYKAIQSAHGRAVAARIYADNSYATSNPGEYFAEGAQIFFNATQRTDTASTGGMTRSRMPAADEPLWTCLSEVYGSKWDCQDDSVLKCFKDQGEP